MYWMDREHRIYDNWALYTSILFARQRHVSVEIVYRLDTTSLHTNLRHFDFECRSLQELASIAHSLGIAFYLVEDPDPVQGMVEFLDAHHASLLVTDMSPLRESSQIKSDVAKKISIPFLQVDAHNIVPVWLASPKLEYQAATFRPKINRLLPEFLTDFPERDAYQVAQPLPANTIDFDKKIREAKIDRSVPVVDWIVPGPTAADAALQEFITQRASGYHTLRNDPNAHSQSNLSPYLRYGNIAPQRVAIAVQDSNMSSEDKEAFLEELIVRREVAENFCWYSRDYYRFEGAWDWARQSLQAHWDDVREFTYTQEQFELANTHDTLWNAAQREMIVTGKMHGFMRMYWAKKILEWSKNPQAALATALYLNDRYELDGRDPNGYTGVMWSICGVHDRAWFERPIFGKIRYMNRGGCERKFDVQAYIAQWT